MTESKNNPNFMRALIFIAAVWAVMGVLWRPVVGSFLGPTTTRNAAMVAVLIGIAIMGAIALAAYAHARKRNNNGN